MSLNITINGQEVVFEGPYPNANSLRTQSGVYLITTKASSDGQHEILDAGESQNIQFRVANHDRSSCWNYNKIDGLFFSAYYCDEATRLSIERDIRNSYDTPCGKI